MSANNANKERSGITNLKNTLYIDTLNTNSLHLGKGNNHELKKIYQDKAEKPTNQGSNNATHGAAAYNGKAEYVGGNKNENRINIETKVYIESSKPGENEKEGHNLNQNGIKKEVCNQSMESSSLLDNNNVSTNQLSASATNRKLPKNERGAEAKKPVSNYLICSEICTSKIFWIFLSLVIFLIILLLVLSLTIWNKSENLPTKNENQVTSLDSLHKIYDENKDNIVTTSETTTINQGSWTELESYYIDKQFGTSFTAFYAGYKIDCKGEPKFVDLFQWRYDCRCVDVLTQVSIKCRNHKSQRGACKGALVSLLQEMIEKQVYPVPVDASSMQYRC